MPMQLIIRMPRAIFKTCFLSGSELLGSRAILFFVISSALFLIETDVIKWEKVFRILADVWILTVLILCVLEISRVFTIETTGMECKY